MNLSDHWRSLFTVASVFPAPSLLSSSSSAAVGPLLFRPSPPPQPLLSTPSPSPPPPPLHASALLSSLRSFLPFLSSAALQSIAADVLPDHTATSTPTNNLHALRLRNNSLALFFPAGANAHSIAHLTLSFTSTNPTISNLVHHTRGFKHPCHRILRMQAVAATPDTDPPTEGFLLVTTEYSVNWFRVESAASNLKLVPVAKQGFKSAVVHACWSPHIPDESVVLLKNGDLCWFDMSDKHGGTVRVELGDGEPLSCEFGGQPWVVLVASSTSVVFVDLITGNALKYLARIDMHDAYSTLDANDRFVAFCKAGFSDFYFTVVLRKELLLFDVREPLVPVLRWDHGLENPSYVTMFKLSELRPPVGEFKWASESGFAILVGSFSDDEFNLFPYGPKGSGGPNGSSLYAWELPSFLSLSGLEDGLGDILFKDSGSREEFPPSSANQHKDFVAGFYVIPNDLSTPKLEPAGFSLLRLMFSGKLEIQNYHAHSESYTEMTNWKGEDLGKVKDSITSYMNPEGRAPREHICIKLQHLHEYTSGNLSSTLANKRKINPSFLSHDLMELSKRLKSSVSTPSSFVSDVGAPTSIHEIASRKVLAELQTDLLSASFSKHSDLFPRAKLLSCEFLEVPSSLAHHNLPPFFMVKPFKRIAKSKKKGSSGEALVGPVLPVPVLTVLQEIDMGDTPCLNGGVNDDDLLNRPTKMVLDNVFPEISIADSGNGWDASQESHEEKPFFVYEPTKLSSRSSCKENGSNETMVVKEELHSLDTLKEVLQVSDSAINDKKYTTFICGITEDTSCAAPVKEPGTSEMLNLSTVRLDFDSSDSNFQTPKKEVFGLLKKQFAQWLENFKPYDNFCSSYNIRKLPP